MMAERITVERKGIIMDKIKSLDLEYYWPAA